MPQKNIRQSFLTFFKDKGHTVVPSDSLIPSSDPSLLFTSAGMVQFKALFLQQVKLPYKRATSSQRCIRTTDIEQVGITPRHLTLFEMLGNFSFGDYFKEDAIVWAWEFLTKTLDLPEKRLWPTVYKDDDEAFKIWKKIVPESKISRMGEESNFWNMGPTGPCGPCSEIYWDLNPSKSTKGPDESDRWMEVWNLVFTQFDRQENGKLNSLPQKNIDTGMGLERLTSVVEGVDGNFSTSLFKPLLAWAEDQFKYKQGKNKKSDVSLKITADHLRAVTLLAYDGILPSNEGRGYVMRRLLRRAVRQGSLFGLSRPFLHKGVSLISEMFKETADELSKRLKNIEEIIKQEEERFIETLETGSEKLNELIKSSIKTVSGKDVFRLYDTYGYPPELTKEILEENNLFFDQAEFDTAKTQAQSLAREGWKGSGSKDSSLYNTLSKKIGLTKFLGYDTLETKQKISAIIKDGKSVNKLEKGETGELFFSESPFYPEGGGQVGDKGWIKDPKTDAVLADVLDTQKPINSFALHAVKAKAPLKFGQPVKLHVDPQPPGANQTASHRHPSSSRRAAQCLGFHGHPSRIACRAGPPAV